jgi:hypothetical protein
MSTETNPESLLALSSLIRFVLVETGHAQWELEEYHGVHLTKAEQAASEMCLCTM